MLTISLLFIAGLFGGVINSIAGGGSFITFPALLVSGLPPIIANATNTFAASAGYLSGAYAFKEDIAKHKNQLPVIILLSLIGGISGAWFLLQTPDDLFREAIPWLLLFATIFFIYGERINLYLKSVSSSMQYVSLLGKMSSSLLLLFVCFYGGFFNAGLGIIILSYLAVAGYTNINAMNGLKLLISSTISIISIVLFISNDKIAWLEGGSVLLGTLVGGYFAAYFSRQVSPKLVRTFIIFASIGITLYFFYDIYFDTVS